VLEIGIYLAVVVFGWLAWLFKPHLVNLIARMVGTAWHLATRRHLDDQSPTALIVHKHTKILRVQQFLRISPRA
jgi:hypothetical protein